jgi:catechol 2,3-dioxygenase-like lactoylglutathione lyase family enzyme
MLNDYKLVGFLPTTDYARARSFYEGGLGLEFVSQDQFALVLRSGGNRIRIVRMDAVTPPKGTVLGWEVSGIQTVVTGLQKEGIVFEKYPWVQDPEGLGIWTAPNGDRVAWFKDPDGNILSVSEQVSV